MAKDPIIVKHQMAFSQYGPANDANTLPAGGSTRSIARPNLGSIPYGGNGIYHCSVPGTVAITYDDGPYSFTQEVIDQFNTYGYKATFFITGNNNAKGPIDTTSSWVYHDYKHDCWWTSSC